MFTVSAGVAICDRFDVGDADVHLVRSTLLRPGGRSRRANAPTERSLLDSGETKTLHPPSSRNASR